MTEKQENSGSEVIGELESLSRQLVTAVRALWDSEDSRKLRGEIGEGFVELGRQVDEAIRSAQESEAAKEFKGQMKEAMDKARESDIAGQVEQGLASGLHELNVQLSKVVDSLQRSGAVTEEPAGEAEAEGEGPAPNEARG
jgi:hypothetical protein